MYTLVGGIKRLTLSIFFTFWTVVITIIINLLFIQFTLKCNASKYDFSYVLKFQIAN